jgi:hypothetical protein
MHEEKYGKGEQMQELQPHIQVRHLAMPFRAKYVDTLLRLTVAGSEYLLWCFEWEPRRWERRWHQLMALVPGDARSGSAKISMSRGSPVISLTFRSIHRDSRPT